MTRKVDILPVLPVKSTAENKSQDSRETQTENRLLESFITTEKRAVLSCKALSQFFLPYLQIRIPQENIMLQSHRLRKEYAEVLEKGPFNPREKEEKNRP